MTDVPVNHALPLLSGGRIPVLGLGTWQLTGERAYDAVRAALEIGYRHIDTATMYGNEDVIGRALADSGVARDEVFVTTKFPAELLGHEREALEASLGKLRLEYVDLWLIHWPPGGRAAPQTWQEFVAAQERGQARNIGVSNYSLAQITELVSATGVTPVVNQIPWSPRDYDAQLVAGHQERGIVLEGYSAFKRSKLDAPAFQEIAAAHGVTTAQVILRWHIEHDIVAIPKSSSRDRLSTNFTVWDFALSPGEVAAIDAMGGAG
ncbi:MAG: 2,5-diketo-D-gluconate reductase [Frankiaceae bacterium]|nr:2,5-diketo-D-gluconate reductase [Frankiaceae bacterium]